MRPYCMTYFGTIIIVTKNFAEHLFPLKKVLNKIYEAGLAISDYRSIFCRSEVRYLGFRVNKRGLRTDSEQVAPFLTTRSLTI